MKKLKLSLLLMTALSIQTSAKTVQQEQLFQSTEILKPLNIFKTQEISIYEIASTTDVCTGPCTEIRNTCLQSYPASECGYEFALCMEECDPQYCPDSGSGGGGADGENTEDGPG